jgi:hypothetical protein
MWFARTCISAFQKLFVIRNIHGCASLQKGRRAELGRLENGKTGDELSRAVSDRRSDCDARRAPQQRKSDARTHRTPQALRAKSNCAPLAFAKLLECECCTPLNPNGACGGARRHLIQTPLQGQQFQSKTHIELAAVIRAATGQTGDGAFDLAYAREIAPAIRASVNETRRVPFRRKWQRMTPLLACDSQIATSLLPLGSVR